MKDSTRSSAVDSSIDQRGKRFHDPTLSDRGFAVFFVVTILIAAVLLLAPKARAATFTWDGNAPGGTGNPKWTTANNWAGDVAPPTSGADLVFAGTQKLVPSMDATYSILSLSFSGASAFSLLSAGTETLTIGTGGITNNNTNATGQTINSPLILGAAQTWNAASGPLTITSNTITNGGFLLTISGASNTSIASAISGTGGLTKTGSGTLTLTAPNTSYTGATTISAGTLSASSIVVSGGNSNLGNAASAVVLGDATNQGTLNYTGAAATYTRGFTVNAGGGQLTNAGSGLLTVSTGGISTSGTFTAGGASGKDIAISSVISGTGGLTKTGADTVTVSGANTYSGATTVNSGTLSINNNNTTTARLANTSGITVNSGGTLLLAQSGGTASTDRIKDSAGITLSGGGTFKTGGLSEGTRPTSSVATNGAAGMGALTLTSTSAGSHATIDFLTGANGSSLVFSSLSGGNLAFVDIKFWTGTLGSDNGLTGNDRFLFATDPGLTNAELANYQFFNDAGTAFAVGGTIISYGNMFELVPVPEPSTWVGGALAFTAIGFTQRRRFARLVRRTT